VKKVLDSVMAHAKVIDKELPREEESASEPAKEQDHAPSA